MRLQPFESDSVIGWRRDSDGDAEAIRTIPSTATSGLQIEVDTGGLTSDSDSSSSSSV